MEQETTRSKFIIRFCTCAIVLGTFFSGAFPVHAATYTIYFVAPKEVPLGVEFPVKVLVDSDQPLNAYNITVDYSGADIVSFNNGKSIIDVWQKQPLIYGGAVKFNGGSLTPFKGAGGELMTINFKAAKEGEAKLGFEKTTFYLANGKGTEVAPQTKDFSITVVPQTASSSIEQFIDVAAVADNTPPDIKYLAIVPDPINADQKLVSFFVGDAGSGVKSTSLRTRSYLFWNDWQVAQNPTAIPNSVWAVDFKAADNNGNIVDRVIYDKGALWRLVLIASAVMAGIILLLILLIKKSRRQNEKTEIN